MQQRNEEIRVRCPACSMLVQLQRRKQPNSQAVNQPTPAPTAALVFPNPALGSNDGPVRQSASLPESSARSPSLAWQLLWPQKFRPAQLPQDTKKRSRRWEPHAPPLKLFALAATLIAAAAVVLAAVTPFGALVTPLSILAALLALGTLALAGAARAPRRWPAAAAVSTTAVLVLVVFYPNALGQKYAYYRNPELDPSFTFVTPKRGVRIPDAAMPKEPSWADASKFGLDRDWFHFQIDTVSVGPASVRPLSSSEPPRTEPHLMIAVEYGSVRASKTGTNPTADQCGKLTVTLYDARGERYERQDLALASLWAKARSLSDYVSGGTIQETLVFAVPPELEDGLRMEINVPPLGATPLTFTIPRSMISIQRNLR